METQATTPTPLLQPQHLLASSVRGRVRIIPELLSTYASVMSEDHIQASLNWMRLQRQDMARFLAQWIERWRQHGYSPESILQMLSQLLQNLCR